MKNSTVLEKKTRRASVEIMCHYFILCIAVFFYQLFTHS